LNTAKKPSHIFTFHAQDARYIVYLSLTKSIVKLSLSQSQDRLRKLYFLSNWMGYDRGDSFPFDFEPNGISFDLKSNGKLSPQSYPIQFERKWKYSFLSLYYEPIFLSCLPSKHSEKRFSVSIQIERIKFAFIKWEKWFVWSCSICFDWKLKSFPPSAALYAYFVILFGAFECLYCE